MAVLLFDVFVISMPLLCAHISLSSLSSLSWLLARGVWWRSVQDFQQLFTCGLMFFVLMGISLKDPLRLPDWCLVSSPWWGWTPCFVVVVLNSFCPSTTAVRSDSSLVLALYSERRPRLIAVVHPRFIVSVLTGIPWHIEADNPFWRPSATSCRYVMQSGCAADRHL